MIRNFPGRLQAFALRALMLSVLFTPQSNRADLIVNTFGGGLSAFDETTGTFHGRVGPGGGLDSGVAYKDGFIYSANRDNLIRYSIADDVSEVIVPYQPGGQYFRSVEIGPDGMLYAGLFGGISKYRPSGEFLGEVVSGNPFITDFTFGPAGDVFAITVKPGVGNEVLRYNGSTGALEGVFVPAGTSGAPLFGDLIFGPTGNLYITTQGTASVQEFNGTTGAYNRDYIAANAGGALTMGNLAFSPDGDLYVTANTLTGGGDDTTKDKILIFDGDSQELLRTISEPYYALWGAADMTFAPVWSTTIILHCQRQLKITLSPG